MCSLNSTWSAAGINLSSMVHQITSGTLDSISQWFTGYGHQSQGINLVALCYSERVTPPMIGGTCLYLSILLLINKFHYRVSVREDTTYVVKPSFIVQEK